MDAIYIAYIEAESRGAFRQSGSISSAIWTRLQATASSMDATATFANNSIEVQWRCALELLRMHAPLQRPLNFRFNADQSATEHIRRFQEQVRAVSQASGSVQQLLTPRQIGERLRALGWNVATHELTDYQFENVATLLALPNGANFSVPGAGKTTVTFALHLLFSGQVDHLLVVAPKNAFPAWEDVTEECLGEYAPPDTRAPLVHLVGGEFRISQILRGGDRRFIISYDQLSRVELLIRELFYRHRIHLVLDESHKIKDANGKRGRTLQRLSHLAARRDILSGTPMPQSAADLQSQLDFLWPGVGLGSRISRGEAPRAVISGLFVRTTKKDLRLEPRVRVSVEVSLTNAHLTFYSVVRDEIRSRASQLRRGTSGVALKRARQLVVRLLQAAVNPELVARHLLDNSSPQQDALLRAVISEGPSARLLKAVELTRQLVTEGRKVLIWTIFTPSLLTLADLLADLNPAVIYGQVGLGEDDDASSRQGQIKRFKFDSQCMVMIANPAAAAEGMSLHMACHDAMYVDRSYNATHYLQSVDRIHRLGLQPNTITTVYVLENRLPFGVGSIDVSVARRLAKKIRAMEQLLGDADLNALALDEEEMDGALDESIDVEDIDDLIREIEGTGGVEPAEVA